MTVNLAAPVYSVPEAARRLGVNSQRVHQLMDRGALVAHRVGGRWLIEADALDQRRSQPRLRGRPYAPRIAWAALLLLSGARPDWLEPSELSRLKKGMARLPLDELIGRVQNRATTHRFHAHPAALARLADDGRLLRTGVFARGLGVGLSAHLGGSYYVRDDDREAVQRAYGLVRTGEINLVLRSVPGPWPFAQGRRDAPAAAVMMDLLEEPDERSRRAARALGKRLVSAMPGILRHDA
jgi:excisionase family DNA binding protein